MTMTLPTVQCLAIMQPTYLPWIGYFDLIDQSDQFVFLDSVQFEKRSWQQRNRIKGPEGIHWLTVPVQTKGKHDQLIQDVQLSKTEDFPDKHIKMIQFYYAKAPFFKPYFEELRSILSKDHDKLSDLNIELIEWACSKLAIQKPFRRSSSLGCSGRNVELLVNICKLLGATRYLSAQGSKVYIDEHNLFGPRGIELIYHDYQPHAYSQLFGPFVSHLSILDLLFNHGPGSIAILRKGRGPC